MPFGGRADQDGVAHGTRDDADCPVENGNQGPYRIEIERDRSVVVKGRTAIYQFARFIQPEDIRCERQPSVVAVAVFENAEQGDLDSGNKEELVHVNLVCS